MFTLITVSFHIIQLNFRLETTKSNVIFIYALDSIEEIYVLWNSQKLRSPSDPSQTPMGRNALDLKLGDSRFVYDLFRGLSRFTLFPHEDNIIIIISNNS